MNTSNDQNANCGPVDDQSSDWNFNLVDIIQENPSDQENIGEMNMLYLKEQNQSMSDLKAEFGQKLD